MFHNVLMTTLAPMRDTNEFQNRCWDNKPFPTIWPEVKQEKSKETNITKTIKKKKRIRTMFTTEQVRVLEKVFARSKYIDVERRREISECLQIEQKCIKIWFQNRRMKEKKELSESCDSTSESQMSSLEALSPALESSDRCSNEFGNNFVPPHVQNQVRPSAYYYNAPIDVHKIEVKNEQNSYEVTNNSTVPESLNYNNNNLNSNILRSNTDYSALYYPQTDYQYYYNMGEVKNQYTPPNFYDCSANIYDTSYF